MTTYRLTTLMGNSQKLDGGAMFGNAPKALWQRWIETDDQNRIDLACRCLLVQTDTKTILFETGIGAFFSPDMRTRYGINESNHVLVEELGKIGLSPSDIDQVVISHLHFDHAGGLLSEWQENEQAELIFNNAEFVVSKTAWERALSPHFRDRASFIPDIQRLLEASGRLTLVEAEDAPAVLGAGFRFHLSSGHTPGMLLTEIPCQAGPVLFAADLIPGAPWVHLPITMGYDRYPELLIDEKQSILADIVSRKGYLYFTHDAKTAMGKVNQDERGRFSVIEEQHSLNSFA